MRATTHDRSRRRAHRKQRLTRARKLAAASALASLALALAFSSRAPSRVARARTTTLASNGRIVFTSDRDGNLEIYSMNADGTDERRLTNNPAKDAQPVWSPDGAKIAFASDRTGQTNIFVMNADGSGVTQITHNDSGFDTRVYDPAWSADGKKLAYVSSFMGEISQLAEINADGTGSGRTLMTTTETFDPAYSPDGTRVAAVGREGFFNPEEGVAFHVFVAQADGSGVSYDKRTRVRRSPYVNFGSFSIPPDTTGPTWSPDGTKIAYSYNDPSPATGLPRTADIAVVNADGGGAAVFLTTSPAHETQPAWSPDGAKIVYTSDATGSRQLFTMNADGTAQTQITSGAGNNFDADWQPVGFTPPRAPTTIQLRNESFRVREAGAASGGDRITVTRGGDLSLAATVDFTTADVDCSIEVAPGARCRSASERSDYLRAFGTLRFEPGEVSKTIPVTIIDDALVEGDEVFGLYLSNAQGASLGRAISLVTITDDDTQSGARNPIDDPRFFVRMHYLDFLGREPEAEGWDVWTSVLQSCPDARNLDASSASARCDRVGVSSSFFRSPEFYLKGYFVYRFYTASLGRRPTYDEFTRDLAAVAAQTAAELDAKRAAFAAAWTSRADFRALYDADADADAFVDHLLRTAGVALAGAVTRDTLVADLRAGAKTRAGVVRAVVESAAEDAKEFNGAFVTMQYFGYLHRDSDPSGYADWTNYLNAHPGDYRMMVYGFINSPEYRARFGQP